MQPSQGRLLPDTWASEVQYLIVSREDSSSATTSNLPGPSRVVGKMFSLLGAKLERRINLAADRLGYGPLALRRKLMTKHHIPSLMWTLNEMTAKQREEVVKELMGYISSGTSLTQSQTLELICELILQDSSFRDEFLGAGLYAELQDLWIYCNMARKQYQYLAHRDPDLDFLFASSRKALVFVEENEVNTVAKPFLSLKEEEFWKIPSADRLAMVSTLLHVYAVLSHQAYHKETRNTPIGTLALAYCKKLDLSPRLILRSFYMAYLRTESLVAPLSTEKIELCIRAYFLPFFQFILTDKIFVRHCTFKSLAGEKGLRYYSMVQRAPAYYNGDQEPDFWDDIPLPTHPGRYSDVEMELISVTKIPVDLSKLDELRFSLPTALDHAIIRDADVNYTRNSAGMVQITDFLTVWEISSES